MDLNQHELAIFEGGQFRPVLGGQFRPVLGGQFQTGESGQISPAQVVNFTGFSIKALTAFYSAMGGSNCSREFCDLTTALELGKQGSDRHKNLIKTYFPNDKVAETVLKQDCYLRPSGASSFSDFEYLTLIDKGDSVYVNYRLMYYNSGEIIWFDD